MLFFKAIKRRKVTYVWHHVLEPRIFLGEFLKPLASRRASILLPSIDSRVLEVDARFWDVPTESLKLGPGSFLEPLQVGAWLAYRKIVRTGPRGSIFNVIVAGHVLGDDGDAKVLVLRQHLSTKTRLEVLSHSQLRETNAPGRWRGQLRPHWGSRVSMDDGVRTTDYCGEERRVGK